MKILILSDLHIGNKYSQINYVNDVLENQYYDIIILNGDILDLWKMSRKVRWTKEDTRFITNIKSASDAGTKIYYAIGNHDDMIQIFGRFDNLYVDKEFIIPLDNGINMLVTHGDKFDLMSKHFKAVELLGSFGYELLLYLNDKFNYVRSLLMLNRWSFAKYIKKKTKNAVQFISNFEKVCVSYAKQNNCKVIVTGHIHTPNILTLGDVLYLNSGDMMESCTMIEYEKGIFTLYDLINNKKITEYKIG